MATKAKNPAAVALGRLGGKKKVPKGFSALEADERKANATAAATARWEKYRAEKAAEEKPTKKKGGSKAKS